MSSLDEHKTTETVRCGYMWVGYTPVSTRTQVPETQLAQLEKGNGPIEKLNYKLPTHTFQKCKKFLFTSIFLHNNSHKILHHT